MAVMNAELAGEDINEQKETQTQTAETETQTKEEGATGLPSDNQEVVDPLVFSEDMITDGKIDGRWKSTNDMLTSYKELEKAYANTKREQSDATKSAEIAQAQQQGIQEMLPAFLDNGMQLNDEMTAKANELGIDYRDIKIGAMELRENINAAHSLVGGADTYNQMIADMGADMTDAQKAVFDKNVTNEFSEFTIMGMYSAWMEKTGRRPQSKRIQGDAPANSSSVKPYSDQGEMLADLHYLRSSRGRNDKAALAKYEARKRVTPDQVVFGKA